MSEYIHQDDAYAWLRDKEIVFAEQDFAKVQAERDEWKDMAEQLSVYAQKHDHDNFRTCDVCRLLTKFVGMQRRGR